MKRTFLLFVLVSLLGTNTLLAQKNITLEDIWQDYTFVGKSIPGFTFQKDGKHYTRLEKNKIIQYDLTTGKATKTILDATTLKGQAGFSGKIASYTFSSDESKILLTTDKEPIYRYSFKANYYVWDGAKLTSLFDKGKQMYANFSPEADKVAFVHDNNLYIKDLTSQKTTTVTTDGKINEIINGGTDWVYEEEFAFSRAFEWSPNGKRLAYFRFDESQVKEYILTHFREGLYPEYEKFKYPKVGEKNSEVSIHIYDLKKNKTITVDVGTEKDQYIPRIKWTNNPKKLCVYRLNRHQNHIELLLADSKTGATKVILDEKNEAYIAQWVLDNLTFVGDDQFIWTSEKDGWHHIYLHNLKDKSVKQLTHGEYEITKLYGYDKKNKTIFFQAAKESPLQREIYALPINATTPTKLTSQAGTNSAQFSSTFDYFVNTYSNINTPRTYKVYDRNAKLIRTIEDNSDLINIQKAYNVSPVEFTTITTEKDVVLNAYTIKPPNFDPTKKYPVFMYLYGGPGSQQVVDSWRGQNYWWFQMLAQQGYIIACVDNRGTGGRGEAFKKITYQQLGHYETIDQINAAKYLASLPYTDANRIGIFGWSYGGYMSSSCLFKGNDVFKAAIAIAPVTNWKWYDTIYTERFMRTEKENPKGYHDNSPVNFAHLLKGNLFVAHGTGDDNVHFQNTAELFNALIKANKQYTTYIYPNRNHGIYGGTTRLHLYRAMTNFLTEKLMNDHRPINEL